MKIIYIDENYKCHVSNGGAMREIETDVFDSLCNGAIECHIFVPAGETYHGVVCTDNFIQCIDSINANACQEQYEFMIQEISSAYSEGVNSI